MNRNIYYLPQVKSILTQLSNYNIAQHIIKNYTIDETTEKYQNVIDQLQFLTKEHNYQINNENGLRWPKDTPFYEYILTKNMLKHEIEPSIYSLYEKLFKKQYEKKYRCKCSKCKYSKYKYSKGCIHCKGEFDIFKIKICNQMYCKNISTPCRRHKCRCLYNYIPKKINIFQ